uniref:Uncharacterized protein n=1 Tax=Dunaliella tertiolecta TaxID=3047 RepID=A0A6S8PAZ0_DUNTE|mmetsp:Transcript_30113/g.78134  ORF Transcript_30113/g.78134 Transcript_30113/m.78134 type:complete len:108 (+) Transcript_30113:220-543(+)
MSSSMPTDGMTSNAQESPRLLQRLDKESWQQHKIALDKEWIVAFLRERHPLRLDFASQCLYTTLMFAWLQYEGPLPEPAPTPRQLKRIKDKEKKHMRQAMKAQDAQQ